MHAISVVWHFRRELFLFACVLCITTLPGVAAGWQGVSDAATRRKPQGNQDVLRDDFDKALSLDWEVVRENKKNVSLKDYPGELLIVTERGSIYEDQDKDRNAPGGRAKNLHLIENPLEDDADWQLTTCLVGFAAVAQDNQAGILVYEDDENYVKCVVQFSSRSGKYLRLAAEKDMVYTRAGGAIDAQQENVWIRLTREGESYSASVSYDGEKFAEFGQVEWDRSPKRFGLIAKNGGKINAPSVEARFDFFEFQSIAQD